MQHAIEGDYSGQELRLVAKWIDEVNEANGFTPPTWDSLPVKVVFVVTELDEAMQAIDGSGDDPIEVELADTAIRLLSILNSVFGSEWKDRTTTILKISPHNVYEPGPVLLWHIVRPLCQTIEYWAKDNRRDALTSLELALKETWSLAVRLGFNPGADIIAKVRKNTTRSKWHGKAKSAC